MFRWVLLVPVLLAACATTGSDGGSMTIETTTKGQPLAGANCIVTTGAGNWNVTTPATINVGAASGDLRVVCNREGYRTSELLMRPSNPVNSGLGVGLGGGGGNLGVGVGLNVPVRLGRGGYAPRVVLEMNPL